MKEDINNLKEEFFKKFGKEGNRPAVFFSPGRVNLIGEHTDYNGGYVFPCALDFGTYLVIRKTSGQEIKLSSLNFDGMGVFPVAKSYKKEKKDWTNYPVGVINEFVKAGVNICGLEMLFYGNIPNGAGLSSSASIEMVTAVAVNDMFSVDLEMMQLVKMSQKAENMFVGMNCGIMDQFAVGFGKKNHAINLNCSTLEYRYAKFHLGSCKMVITNTNKQRGLTDSKYNERRSECEKAVRYLCDYKKISKLSEISINEIDALEKYIPDPIIRKRAKHVITENARTLAAIEALNKNKISAFGELMNQSHDSLSKDYEVTGNELDTLVYEGRKLPGVIGTRMTGAGFGGCTVSIVEGKYVDEFMDKLSKIYNEKTGLKAEFYLPGVGDGACRIS